MVVDTELHPKHESEGPQRPLDVDQFFSSIPIPPQKPGIMEATLCAGPGDEIMMVLYSLDEVCYAEQADPYIFVITSTDQGRTWGPRRNLVDTRGELVRGHHITMLRLKSGRLGLVHSNGKVTEARPGRDGGTVFRTSDDEGLTWSDPTELESRFGICTSGHAMVHSNGRIVVPIYKWISQVPGGEAESFNAPSLSYCWVCVSDDEGKTWQKSLSELFISHYRAAFDLEEPVAVELKDGRLLMHMRSQVGRIYRSYSEDFGISWSRPEPLPIAASYTPCILKRIEATGHLLMVWNQISRQEILTGLHRHRLSCAVSSDEGETWENFKNLESLDDTTVVTPPPDDRLEVMEQWENYGYYQPSDTGRYHRAPGVLRICYPDVAISGDEAVFVYDWGEGNLGEDLHGVKSRTVPIKWLTE